ncbi:MAG TPA: right-handed parallel beta-helix repeat-containing protein [Verrucomicrobiae bacterium]|nr:right-handed parallel beta-helix repeat-containing protein [Verrucomicrobiae bacterium]
MTKPLLLVFLIMAWGVETAPAREWFVRQADPNASDTGDGSAVHPLRTINAAAQLAQPGDVISVGPGIYHEWVSPARSGNPNAPILYRSVPEHAAVVRGTDVFHGAWQEEPEAKGVFSAALPQSAFIFGDPFVRPPEPSDKKKGEKRKGCSALVFCNDQTLSQVKTREELIQTPGSWLSSDDGGKLFVHLHDNSAPAIGEIEVTTRDRIFAPHRRGLGHIQVEGFVFERCATRPDWPQLGALSTRSGHDWIIRNNLVRQTTGKGIDCGSETWEPDSLIATEAEDKHIMIGGNHLVESNFVTDNFQCGIAAWNTDNVRIIGNIVSNNCASASADNRSLTDFEAGGIKVHAFRNGVIQGNLVVSNSSFGIWLDNGWENARVTRNLTIGNRGAGIFVELGFGPVLVDHNVSAANLSLGSPYFGDGIYTHDASGVTITHNTFMDNAHYGAEQLIVSERVYWPKRVAEASNETITGNLFYGNGDGDISLPLRSSRAHDNQSDYNAIEAGERFIINNNNGRIPKDEILKTCRDRLHGADLPKDLQSETSDTNRLPILSLSGWRAVMQMDSNSTTLPANLRIRLDTHQNQLQIEMPGPGAIAAAPADAAHDADLFGQPCKTDKARAGAVQNLHAGAQTLSLWPLP